LKDYYINCSDPELEERIRRLWVSFWLKSQPVPCSQRGFSAKITAAHQYFDDYFQGNLCLFVENKGFAIFGDGRKYLDTPQNAPDGKLATLIMGASINPTLKEGFSSIKLLKECFSILGRKYGYDIVAWNQNREFKKKPFERMMKKLGAEQTGDCFYLKL
jgi:hypothetical protein